jgi:hypothetical protein
MSKFTRKYRTKSTLKGGELPKYEPRHFLEISSKKLNTPKNIPKNNNNNLKVENEGYVSVQTVQRGLPTIGAVERGFIPGPVSIKHSITNRPINVASTRKAFQGANSIISNRKHATIVYPKLTKPTTITTGGTKRKRKYNR